AAPPLGTQRPQRLRGEELFRVQVPPKNKRPAKPLRFRLVAGGVHEGVELLVRHGGRVDPERRQLHLVHRSLAIRGKPVAAFVAHQTPPAGQPLHPFVRAGRDARKNQRVGFLATFGHFTARRATTATFIHVASFPAATYPSTTTPRPLCRVSPEP